jgi:pyrroline-5-carboxylate reductase
MGSAIIGGLLRQQLVAPTHIIATDPNEERRRALHNSYQIGVGSDNAEAARNSQIIIFAVKPQIINEVLAPLRGALPAAALCMSVVAGTPITTFAQTLDHAAIVRSIPNTPAHIGEGMTVWTATEAVSETQRAQAAAVLGALGRARFVASEHYLDMATAISGSGPAYVFLMLEAMIDAGVHLGFARDVAAELVLQTMLGAVRYAQQSETHPAQLRNAVTSPAGTTAAGLNALEQGRLRAVLSEAIWAAYHRSRELGSASSDQASKASNT